MTSRPSDFEVLFIPLRLSRLWANGKKSSFMAKFSPRPLRLCAILFFFERKRHGSRRVAEGAEKSSDRLWWGLSLSLELIRGISGNI
jgi:hypothetical protein